MVRLLTFAFVLLATAAVGVAAPVSWASLGLDQAQITGANIIGSVPSDDPATAVNDDPTTVTVVSEPGLATSIKTVSDQNGGDFVPGLVGVQAQGNDAADGFTDGANAGDVFCFARANFDLDGFRAVLNMLFCRGCHFFGRVNADGAVGVDYFLFAAEQGI